MESSLLSGSYYIGEGSIGSNSDPGSTVPEAKTDPWDLSPSEINFKPSLATLTQLEADLPSESSLSSERTSHSAQRVHRASKLAVGMPLTILTAHTGVQLKANLKEVPT